MDTVNFQSEGETLIGNLFLPNSSTPGEKLPAVIVGGSWITVKEQMSKLYAERLPANTPDAMELDDESRPIRAMSACGRPSML